MGEYGAIRKVQLGDAFDMLISMGASNGIFMGDMNLKGVECADVVCILVIFFIRLHQWIMNVVL
jgi:hypothetical protein